MKKWSQRLEQPYILQQFRGLSPGNFLDIGAFHPEALSNTRCLVELGWDGVYVEPSEVLHKPLQQFCEDRKDSNSLTLFPYGIDLEAGIKTFYDSQGDAISSLDKSQVEKWNTVEFKETEIECFKIGTALDLFYKDGYPTFEFIDIDIEGNELEIIKHMDLDALGTKMVCIEYNDAEAEIKQYFRAKGFREVYKGSENLLFVR